jgi:hypothetical protein
MLREGGGARAAPGCSDRVIARAAAAGALIFALAGCGSSTLSARALRTQASGVCTSAVRRGARIAPPRSNSGGTAFLARGITVFRPELEALRKLAPPRGLAVAYRAALADTAQQLDALVASEADLRGGDDPVVAIRQLYDELTAIDARDREAWNAVGAPACSNLESPATRRSG